MNDKIIGWVIADDDEYVPVEALAKKLSGKAISIHGLIGHEFTAATDNGSVTVRSVLCGTGKVNAAAAAAFLAESGADTLVSFGLSGGMSGVKIGDIVAATTLCEHDFDLTVCGYAIGEKPNQQYLYKASDEWIKRFKSVYPQLKEGAVVSGDRFISDDAIRKELVERFGAVACDMESAAVAYVAARCGLEFAALRLISDDAGDDAVSVYRKLNSASPDTLVDIAYSAINT